MGILEQVWQYVQLHCLLTPGDAVVVGVSGGPDSVCLLHILTRLRERCPLRLTVAHLHHGARERDADADAEFVARLAAEWGIPYVIDRQDVPALARMHRLAFEEAARRVRYAFLARVAEQIGARKIAVGHTADDQAETVLMHFLRGSGLAGLRGMLPLTPLSEYHLLEPFRGADARKVTEVGEYVIIRPLLATPRADVERYCSIHNLATRFDYSNLDRTFYRNRLRHELLPILATYNPAIRTRLCNMAEVIAADYALLTQVCDQAWACVVRAESACRITFDLVAWRALPLALQRALLRRAGYRLRSALRDLDFVHIEQARRVALEGTVGAQATLPAGLVVRVGYDTLDVEDADTFPLLPDYPVLRSGEPIAVCLPGLTALPDSEWALQAEVLERWDMEIIESNTDPWTAYLDIDRLEMPLILRVRQPGDYFCPHGMEGHRVKLSAFFINRKVPRAWREHLPLLVAGDKIVWVCGYRLADHAAVTPLTKHVARFRFVRDI